MEKETFVLLPEHAALAQRMYFEWSDIEAGAPCVNPKRPYGNGDHLNDIAEIIGLVLFEDADGIKHMNKIQRAQCEKLHREMETALEVILRSGSFEPGKYESRKFISDWKKV